MYKKILSNPISGKFIKNSKISMLSKITNNYLIKPTNSKNKILKQKPSNQINVTDKEYFEKYY